MSRVAICHDWILDPRGAERVLVELASGWDRLEINTLFLDPARLHPSLRERTVLASTLNRLPGARRYYRYTLPFFRRAALSLCVSDADLVLSISHSVAKAFPRRPGIPHVCYCLTPMRYLWEPHLYGQELRSSLRGLALSYWARSLKSWDRETSSLVDHFVAISKTVQKRIRRVYGRESTLVYPCADLDFYTCSPAEREDYFLVVSGLVPQKTPRSCHSGFQPAPAPTAGGRKRTPVPGVEGTGAVEHPSVPISVRHFFPTKLVLVRKVTFLDLYPG